MDSLECLGVLGRHPELFQEKVRGVVAISQEARLDLLLGGFVLLGLSCDTVGPAVPELERSSQLELAGLATLQ